MAMSGLDGLVGIAGSPSSAYSSQSDRYCHDGYLDRVAASPEGSRLVLADPTRGPFADPYPRALGAGFEETAVLYGCDDALLALAP